MTNSDGKKTLIKLVRDNDNSKLSSVWSNFGGGPTYYETGQFWPVSLFWVTAHKILPLFFGLTPSSLWKSWQVFGVCTILQFTYTNFQVCTACVICCLGTQPVTQSMQNMQQQIVRHDACLSNLLHKTILYTLKIYPKKLRKSQHFQPLWLFSAFNPKN